jgi:hypothetical protein
MRLPAGIFFGLALLVLLPVRGFAKTGQAAPLLGAVIEQAAGRVDDTLTAVAASTKGLAAAYRELSRTAQPVTRAQREHWLRSYAVKDATVVFRDPDSPCGPEPAAQAPCPAFLSYKGEQFTDETFRDLGLMTGSPRPWPPPTRPSPFPGST